MLLPLPIDLTHVFLFIASNASNAVNLAASSNPSALPIDPTSTAGVGGVLATVAGLVGKSLYDKKNDDKVQSWGSETDKILLNDIIDNYNDFKEYLLIEKTIQDLAQTMKDKTYFEILETIVDVSTKETIGQKKARFINKVSNYYDSYYQKPTLNISCPNPNNVVAATMTSIKQKTTAA